MIEEQPAAFRDEHGGEKEREPGQLADLFVGDEIEPGEQRGDVAVVQIETQERDPVADDMRNCRCGPQRQELAAQ